MKPKLHPIAMLLTVAFLLPLGETIIRGKVEPFGKFSLIQAVLMAISIYWWYFLDKAERHFRAGAIQNIGVAVLSIVALPVYFIRSRGWRHGALASAVGFGVLLVAEVLSYLGELAGHRIGS